MRWFRRKSSHEEQHAIADAPPPAITPDPAVPLQPAAEPAVSPQPSVEPAVAPAPQPTREELLQQQIEKVKRSHARAPGQPFVTRAYALAIADTLEQFGEPARASRLRQYVKARSRTDERTSALSMLQQAYRHQYSVRTALLNGVLSDASRIDDAIQALAKARDAELSTLEHRLGQHEYSASCPGEVYLRWSSGEVQGEVRTSDRGWLHTGTMKFPKERVVLLVVAPETMAEQRKAVIARYDPRILELCGQRAQAEDEVRSVGKAYDVRMRKLAPIEQGRAPQLTRDEYRTISSDYRGYAKGTLDKRR